MAPVAAVRGSLDRTIDVRGPAWENTVRRNARPTAVRGTSRPWGAGEPIWGWRIVSRRARAAAAALLAALLLAASAGATTSASPELSRLATAYRNGTAVVALCARTQADWSATLAAHHAPPYVVGFAYIGFPKLWLSPSICSGVVRADPWAVLVFLHELSHTAGIRSERKANCRALQGERRFLQDLLGLSPEQAQAVYEQSLARALAEPLRYRPVLC